MSCPICIDDFNNRGCRRMKCLNKDCQEEYCVGCFMRHMKENNTNGECLFCKTEIDKNIIYEAGHKYQFDDFLRHKSAMFFSRQKSLLPQTQQVLNERKARAQTDAALKEMQTEYRELYRMARENSDNKDFAKALRKQGIKVREDIDKLRLGRPNTNSTSEESENLASGERCPKEDCRGFLNRQRKCLMCDAYSCAKCHEVKNGINDPEHECDPNTVETVKLLAKDSKFCPSCSTTIYKISGCSQMYCTKCFTAFDWNTLKIVTTGVIHNPHFYEMQRRGLGGARNAGDLECGGLPNIHSFKRKLLIEVGDNLENQNMLFILNMYRFITHISHVEMHNFRINEDTGVLLESRIRYLENKTSEKQWVSNVHREMKKVEFNKEMRILLDTFVQSSTGILQRHDANPEPNIIETCELLDEIIKYINDEMMKLTKKYKYKPYQFTKTTRELYAGRLGRYIQSNDIQFVRVK